MATDVSGIYALAADLSAGGRAALPRALVAVRKSAADVKTTAQTLAPVDTGFLRGGIGYTTRTLTTSVVADIGPSADYGAFQEFGTSTHGPQPFMGPALDAHGPSFEAAILALADPLRG